MACPPLYFYYTLPQQNSLSERKNLSRVINIGGGRGIRTPDTFSDIAVFETAPFNRSGIPPFILTCFNNYTFANSKNYTKIIVY